MLKKIRGLFLGLVVLAGSACVTPTHASSAPSIIITSVQASGASGAKEELVTIYNNSSIDVNVTGWCLKNKSAVLFACFTPDYSTDVSPADLAVTTRYVLPAYSSATVASEEYLARSQRDRGYFSLVYKVTNGSSGSIVSSADTVSLIDAENTVVNSTSWTSSLPVGKAWARFKILSAPDVYATNNDTNDWSVKSIIDPLQSRLMVEYTIIEVDDTPSSDVVKNEIPPRITELLPNPAGADTGKEFIELYNSSDETMTLSQYKIRIGIDSFKWYSFPADLYLQPHEYTAFYSDVLHSLTLPNAKGGVQLFRNNVAVGELIQYDIAKDNAAWALFSEAWEFTNAPTPGAENRRLDATLAVEPENIAAEDAKKPCASNQYRNPDTSRCRLVASSNVTPALCKAGQERSLETGRCRTLPKSSAPTPCKAGQERNPETNRCRTITKMTNAAHGVKDISTKADTQTSWYYWLGIGVVVVVITGYAVWEWRQELVTTWQRMTKFFTRQ